VNPTVILPILALAFLVACHERDRQGEEIASVNGQTLSEADLTADLVARHLPPKTSGDKIRAAVTTALVNRKLLADQARAEAIDKDSGYLAIAARAQEVALVEQLLAKWRTSIPMPGRGELQLFIDGNPQMFAGRVIYLVDEVETDMKGVDEKALASLRSMEAVTEYLRQNDHPFRRGSATIDTLTTGPFNARRMAVLAPGEPLISTRRTTFVIRWVARQTPAPLMGDQAFRLAVLLVQKATFQRTLEQNVAGLRAAATITYPPASALAD
jgi:peptidyl-prolyl cis-trans isomerase C